MRRAEEMNVITKAVIKDMQEEENRIANEIIENEIAPLVEKVAYQGQTSVEFIIPTRMPVCATEKILKDLGYVVNITNSLMSIEWGE